MGGWRAVLMWGIAWGMGVGGVEGLGKEVQAKGEEEGADRYFAASDGVRLHYVEAGRGPETMVFVPGWLMPAAVFEEQVRVLSKRCRVVAFDPRSQGKSEVASGRHSPERRSRDLQELLDRVQAYRPILVGWSLGVMEVLDYLAKYRPEHVAGLVLIDNSIGEGRPPAARSEGGKGERKPEDRSERMKEFVHSLTRRPLSERMFGQIYASTMRVSPEAARELLEKPFPREYWRDTLLAQRVPILYAIRPRFEEQGRILKGKRPSQARVEVFEEAGHALFMDEPSRFNRVVLEFAQRAWHGGD